MKGPYVPREVRHAAAEDLNLGLSDAVILKKHGIDRRTLWRVKAWLKKRAMALERRNEAILENNWLEELIDRAKLALARALPRDAEEAAIEDPEIVKTEVFRAQVAVQFLTKAGILAKDAESQPGSIAFIKQFNFYKQIHQLTDEELNKVAREAGFVFQGASSGFALGTGAAQDAASLAVEPAVVAEELHENKGPVVG